MQRRFLHLAIIGGIALSGCAQMTRHSNTMVFGTNTSFGITAGTDATNTPSVSIGYKRQEAVIMPLVANTGETGGHLLPCAVSPTPPENDLQSACLLVAHRENAVDSYSVLASFGATFDASGPNASAKGGLAQYFSTGLAAQVLALRGGAALVSTGEAASESAKAAGPSASALATLLADPQRTKTASAERDETMRLRGEVVAYLGGVSDANFANELAALDTASKANHAITSACAGQTKSACLVTLAGDGLDPVPPAQLKAGLDARRKSTGG